MREEWAARLDRDQVSWRSGRRGSPRFPISRDQAPAWSYPDRRSSASWEPSRRGAAAKQSFGGTGACPSWSLVTRECKATAPGTFGLAADCGHETFPPRPRPPGFMPSHRPL